MEELADVTTLKSMVICDPDELCTAGGETSVDHTDSHVTKAAGSMVPFFRGALQLYIHTPNLSNKLFLRSNNLSHESP